MKMLQMLKIPFAENEVRKVGSGALSGKMLLVRIIEYKKIDA